MLSFCSGIYFTAGFCGYHHCILVLGGRYSVQIRIPTDACLGILLLPFISLCPKHRHTLRPDPIFWLQR